MSTNRNRPLILLAEDSEITAMYASAILREAGYEVINAADGEACLAMAIKQRPDLVVLDLMMPKMHGLEVLQHLRQREDTRGIGVIVCSAKEFKTEADQALELGADGFLPKSEMRKRLADVVRSFFDGGARNDPSEASATPTSTEVNQPVYHPGPAGANALFRFRGTRGSIPVSGPDYLRHGGNTTCLEVTSGDECVLFDAGSGIRPAGLDLVKGGPRCIHLFVTHTHWDHIQGFPFFVPSFVPGFEIHIYAPKNVEKDLESIFRGQLDRAYFPVQMEDMRADLVFHELHDDPVQVGNLTVTWQYALHPGATVGYKVAAGARRIAFFPDNEFAKGYLGNPAQLLNDTARLAAHHEQLAFLEDVDTLIHEAQYDVDEYAAKIGWGHTSVPNGCALAKLAGVDRWIITHHDPEHSDDVLQDKLNTTRRILEDLECRAIASHAFDGLVEPV